MSGIEAASLCACVAIVWLIDSCMWLLQNVPSSRWPNGGLVRKVHAVELPSCVPYLLKRFSDPCLSKPPHTCQATA